MGLGNGNAKSGDKGSNFNSEHRQLVLLGEIVNAIVGGGIPAPSGLATESTLISVLNAIVATDQDIEILLVRDTGNGDKVVQQITDYQTGIPVVTYKDVNGNPYVPVGPLEYLDPSAVLNLILTELQAQSVTLTSLDGKDYATQTTLNNLLTAFNAEDFASQTTLAALLLAFNNEDFASQTTLNSLLTAFNAEDFASETTLAALAAEDFATQTTLASLLTAFNSEDFASEVTAAAILAQLDVDLSTRASEATLAAQAADVALIDATLTTLNTKLNTLGQKASAASAPVVLSTEQEVILAAIQTAVEALNLDADGLAKEVTLAATNALLTTIDAVLDTIKLDTANLDVALSTVATEATLALAKTAIDNIKLDTANLDVALSTRATEATLLATNALLTTIDTVLDSILVDTGVLATPVIGVASGLSRITSAGAGAVSAGKRRVSIFNAGNNDATVAGGTLKKGEVVTFSADGLRDTLAAITYNALTSELLITTVG